MKCKFKKIYVVLLAAVLSLSLLTACTSSKTSDEAKGSKNEQQQSEAAVSSLGDLVTQDINGEAVTRDIFKEHEMTMVNVFTTWCSPCVAEMPDLEKLSQQVGDRNVGVVGVVLDVLNEKGEIVDENLKQAQLLVQKTGVTYPIILPDSTYFNGRLTSIDAVPETFFVDKDGNIVGETYSGSGNLDYWLDVVERELKNLEADS